MKEFQTEHIDSMLSLINEIVGRKPDRDPLLLDIKGKQTYFVHIGDKLYYWEKYP